MLQPSALASLSSITASVSECARPMRWGISSWNEIDLRNTGEPLRTISSPSVRILRNPIDSSTRSRSVETITR